MTWAVPAKSQSKTEKPRLSIEAQCFNRYIPTYIDKQTDQLLNKNVTIPLLFTIHSLLSKKKDIIKIWLKSILNIGKYIYKHM